MARGIIIESIIKDNLKIFAGDESATISYAMLIHEVAICEDAPIRSFFILRYYRMLSHGEGGRASAINAYGPFLIVIGRFSFFIKNK